MSLKWTFSLSGHFRVHLTFALPVWLRIRLFYVQIPVSLERSSTRCFVRVFPIIILLDIIVFYYFLFCCVYITKWDLRRPLHISIIFYIKVRISPLSLASVHGVRRTFFFQLPWSLKLSRNRSWRKGPYFNNKICICPLSVPFVCPLSVAIWKYSFIIHTFLTWRTVRSVGV